jgi:CRP-like cAMP-binding protein
VILATLNPGDYIGEMSLIDNEPHSATCRAEVQTDMLTLGRAEFARCLPEKQLDVVRDHEGPGAAPAPGGPQDRIAGADGRVRTCAPAPLLEFAQPDREGLMTIRERISRQDIAKMVGASREMVSRVMKDLEDRGFIETREDGSMLVKDRLTTLG